MLARRFNTGYEDGKYSVPAGHLDGNETVRQALAREVREEVGIQITVEHVKVVHVMHRKSNEERVDFFLTADSWSGEPHIAEPEKCDDMQWFSLNKLPQNIIPYVQFALEQVQKGVQFSEFGWERGI